MVEAPVTYEAAERIPRDLLTAMYRSMLEIRMLEERVGELLEAKEINCPTHLCIGQEAVPAGVCAALRRDDYVLGNHRSHGHYLAKGGSMSRLMAELYGKCSGCSGGRGGSMHLFAGDVGLLGTVPMVAATIPIAAGAALASTLAGSDRVSVAFFGDAATEEGVFHESLNFAAVMSLPVVFVCENNFFSSHLPLKSRRPHDRLYELAEPYSVPSLCVDGNDVVAVYVGAAEAVSRARSGRGPSFIECRTYRWRGHVGPSWDLDVGIRDPEELAAWMSRCPVKALGDKLLAEGLATQNDLLGLRQSVASEIEAAVHFARESPYPSETELQSHVFVSEE